MRRLMWFSLGFGASCALGAYVFAAGWLYVVGIVALLAGIAADFAAKIFKPARVAAVVFAGVCAGAVWFGVFDGVTVDPAREMDGQTVSATVTLSDYSFSSSHGAAADGILMIGEREYRIRVYLRSDQELRPGTQVSGCFRLRLTAGGGEDPETFHQGQGIYLLAYQTGEVTVESPDEISPQYLAAQMRRELLLLLDSLFPADTEAFARALLLGDGSGIDYTTNTAFKVSGIRHVIAVSGLHVSILFALIYQLSGKRRVLTALIGIPVVLLFVAVAGFTPSVVRAGLMHVLIMLALLFNREYDPPTALSFAALVMLVWNPLVITSVSFQLSVGCMAGILLFSGRIKAWLLDDKRLGHAEGKSLKARMVRWFAGSVSVTLGAISLTMPLSAVYFGTVSLVGVVTNLLVLWIVTGVFYGIMAVCVVGAVWTGLGQIIAEVVSWGIRFILGVTGALASIPGAAVYTQSNYVVVWLVWCYLLFGAFVLLRRKRPVLMSLLAVAGLCVALLVSWAEPLSDRLRVTVLDVGQGKSIILQSEGKTFLVDCGGSYADEAADMAAETLLSMGVSRIDGLIVTHYDADHAGGVEFLLSRIQADALYLPGWVDADQTALRLREYEEGQVYPVGEDIVLRYGTTQITLVSSPMEDSGNESSLCVLFQAADCDILITGDRGTLGERLLMQQLELPELEVLVVGHHGSSGSTGYTLLEQTQPYAAVISVGANNPYGHPSQEVLDRLEEFGCAVFRTDEDGTIIIRR